MMADRCHAIVTPAEIDEHLCLQEHTGNQYSYVSIEDSDADSDYVFDHEEEGEELQAEYFGVFLPASHTSPSLNAGPSHASTSSSPSNM